MGPPHTPQLIGVAERYNRTLLDRLKPSLKNSTLHRHFWSDALEYAVWTTNRSPTRTNVGFMTPYEVYHGKLPSMRHAHVFGSKGVYLIPSANCDKLDSNTHDCYFLSVLPNGDGVKVLDAMTKKTVKTRDTIFDDSINQTVHIPHSQPTSHATDPAAPWLYPENPDPQVHNPDPSNVEERGHEPIRQRPRRDRLVPDRYGNLHAYSTTSDKSPTYRMAMASAEKENWHKAMNAEIDNFIDRKVYTLVP